MGMFLFLISLRWYIIWHDIRCGYTCQSFDHVLFLWIIHWFWWICVAVLIWLLVRGCLASGELLSNYFSYAKTPVERHRTDDRCMVVCKESLVLGVGSIIKPQCSRRWRWQITLFPIGSWFAIIRLACNLTMTDWDKSVSYSRAGSRWRDRNTSWACSSECGGAITVIGTARS